MKTITKTPKTARVKVGRTFEFLGAGEQVAVDGDAHIILYPEERATRDYPGAPSYCELERFECELVTSYDQFDREVYCYDRAQKPDWFALLDRIMFKHIDDNWDTLGRELHYDGATALEGIPDDDA